ncbi:MAG: hypothetical protein JJU45_06435 [Acidimicrobiia bacterium]|nr:hypothetical protein [Acidimicrobiia bacterium]
MSTRSFAVDPSDERPHPPSGEQLWNESWYFDFVTTDGSLGGYVRLGLYPHLGVSWYWACLVGEDRPLVTVLDHEAPLPKGTSLDLRTNGLWAAHNLETPLEHWSLGLEAFGVALDDPTEVYGEPRGERVPLGFDLEWETDGEPYRYPTGLDRYEIPCRVHGEVLVGDEQIAVEAVGQRDHSWGVRDWWAIEWCWAAWRRADGARLHAVTTLPVSLFTAGYDQLPGGGGAPGLLSEVQVFEAVPVDGAAGVPAWVDLSIGERRARATPVGWAPVRLDAPDGRRTHLPRAMCRFEADDGDIGVGWLELNQLQ